MVDAAVVAVAAAAFFVLYKCTEQRKNEKTDFWREFSGSFGLFLTPGGPALLVGGFSHKTSRSMILFSSCHLIKYGTCRLQEFYVSHKCRVSRISFTSKLLRRPRK